MLFLVETHQTALYQSAIVFANTPQQAVDYCIKYQLIRECNTLQVMEITPENAVQHQNTLNIKCSHVPTSNTYICTI